MEIWRLRIECRIHKAVNTHSEYAIPISFALLQWLHKQASVLRYKYIACLVINYFTFYYDRYHELHTYIKILIYFNIVVKCYNCVHGICVFRCVGLLYLACTLLWVLAWILVNFFSWLFFSLTEGSRNFHRFVLVKKWQWEKTQWMLLIFKNYKGFTSSNINVIVLSSNKFLL